MIHTTNYQNGFIEIADDCTAKTGVEPPNSETKKSIARRQYELISSNPYTYTSDELILQLHMERNDIDDSKTAEEREKLFSKGQACMRSSALAKKYGWGIHFDENCKMAICAVDSLEYKAFKNNPDLMHKKAMRSSKV